MLPSAPWTRTLEMERSSIIAALGPTNTGKTFRALVRMRQHETGMIGLPLRLLAREVYDTLCKDVGASEVALITGEEKLIPAAPRYWVCTVEAMPVDREVDFLAVDEIQLAGHHERGHVFTNRLLHARGRKETWFIGSDSMVPLVRRLVPTAELVRYPRLSRLRCEGSYTLGSLPKRSAVVAFSVPRVYEIAERIRAKRGGVAIVLGALSPRARNAQVQMYQEGEVDYLVATDAIGLGLNLDIDRVAFADTRKFDGRQERALDLGELAQIAGRAGRYHSDGAFGTLAPRRPLPTATAIAIEEHNLGQQSVAYFRNADLDFGSPAGLLASLHLTPRIGGLHLPPFATDSAVLSLLLANERVAERITSEESLRLLWDVCQIPDYRKLLTEEHARLTAEIFLGLSETGQLDDEFLRRKILRLRKHSGDIDAIVGRIASVRTWAYVSCRPAWVANQDWQARTRELDDALSDDLHRALVERFVTKVNRTKPKHTRQKKSDRSLSSQLEQLASRLSGHSAPPPPSFQSRIEEASPTEFTVSARGHISLDDVQVASFSRGRTVIEPQLRFSIDELTAEPGLKRKLEEKLRAVARSKVEELLAPLQLTRPDLDEGQAAHLRGLTYQLRHGLGSLRVAPASLVVKKLETTGLAALRATDTTLGRRYFFAPGNLSPERITTRLALVATYREILAPDDFEPSEVHVLTKGNALARLSPNELEWFGYESFDSRAVRIDIVEGVLSAAAKKDKKVWLPMIMQAFACSADEAKLAGRQLGLEKPRRRRRARKSAKSKNARG